MYFSFFLFLFLFPFLYSDIQEELRKAILASIQEVDPSNPWIKDASGRHTNVLAVLDWPDSDSDSSEAETTGTSLKSGGKDFVSLPQ